MPRLHEETRNAMHDTLVNHKRAMLMEHKVQSSVLQQDLTFIFFTLMLVAQRRSELYAPSPNLLTQFPN